MSEVGKIFDSILDYKIRKENLAYRASEEILIESTINSISKEKFKFLEPLKERKALYAYEVCCGEVNDTYTTSIPPVGIVIPVPYIVPYIQLKCLIDKNGVYFEEILKEIGEEKEHKTYSTTENKENLGQLTVYENLVEQYEGRDIVEVENTKIVDEMLKEWTKVSEHYEKDTNTEEYGITNDFLVGLLIDSNSITGKYINGLTFEEMVEAKHSLPYKMNGYRCIVYNNQMYAEILKT